MPLTLNEDQKKATQHVLNAQHQYQAFLLDGLTGSGKTEVYLHIMHEVLKQSASTGVSSRNWFNPSNHFAL